MKAITSIIVGTALTFLGGCAGIESTTAPNPADKNGGTDPDPTENSDPSTNPNDPAAKPGADPLQMLTPYQYNASIRALIPIPGVDYPIFTFPTPIEGNGGFENQAALVNPSSALIEAFQTNAAKVGEFAITTLAAVSPCPTTDAGCAQQLIQELAAKAWRRPLEAGEMEAIGSLYGTWYDTFGADYALALAVEYIVQSPEFVYQVHLGDETTTVGERVPLTSWEIASRLALLLWGTPPDDELIALAMEDKLRTREAVMAQARRLLKDKRAEKSVIEFHRQLFDFDEVGRNGTDLEHYAPVFEAAGAPPNDSDYFYLVYIPLLRYEPEIFIAEHLFRGEGTLATLLTSNRVWTNPAAAKLAYGADVDTSVEPVLRDGFYGDEFADILAGLEIPGSTGQGATSHADPEDDEGEEPLEDDEGEESFEDDEGEEPFEDDEGEEPFEDDEGEEPFEDDEGEEPFEDDEDGEPGDEDGEPGDEDDEVEPDEQPGYIEGYATGVPYYPVDLNPNQRAGILSLASFLSSNAGPRQPSPVRRGVAVLERLICIHLEPPGDVPPLEESTSGTAPKTNREKYLIHVQSEACAGCHKSIDGIGMTFENYDSVGRWRDLDNGYTVDATGELVGTDVDAPVNGWVEMAALLAKSRTVHDCYTRQWFRYTFGRDDTLEDYAAIKQIQDVFWASGGNVQDLIVEMTGSELFRFRGVIR